MQTEQTIHSVEQMEALGAQLSKQLMPGLIVFLHGPLGAGKTTLVRGMLHGLGHTGTVKSPTYTLVEPYRFGPQAVYHFDLYRLQDPEELEFLGLRDYLGGNGICLVEWAERGAGRLPTPDVEVSISHTEDGRRVRLQTRTEPGHHLLRNEP